MRPAAIIEVPVPPSPADLGAHDLQGEAVLGQIVPAAEMVPVPGLPGRLLLGGHWTPVPDLGDRECHEMWGIPSVNEAAAEAARRAADPERVPVATGEADYVPPDADEVQERADALDELINRLNAERNGLRFVRVVRRLAGGEEGAVRFITIWLANDTATTAHTRETCAALNRRPAAFGAPVSRSVEPPGDNETVRLRTEHGHRTLTCCRICWVGRTDG